MPCFAQDAPANSPAAAASAAAGPNEPQVQRTVIEDDRVRIDELRVRGTNRRIVVQSKLLGAPAYEIGTQSDARGPGNERQLEGRSLWQLFAF